ncbi:MAG TPA: glycine-rich protein, partial [Acidimicrobiia bacterium]|nr:glycine-rich protein [Acidimicrobiia bacterium]
MRARVLIVGVGAVGWVTLCAPHAGAQTTGPVTVSFTTPGTSSYSVPAGICQVTVDARGAAGGSADISIPLAAQAAIQAHLGPAGSGTVSTAPPGFVHAAADTGSGGLGGETTATVPVTPGETLTVTVGGAGQDLESSVPDGGTPDGGSGGAGDVTGAGGGGSSDVRQ